MLEKAGIKTLDKCPIHRCNEVKTWLETKGLAKEPRPAYSPDLSQFDNVRGYMKRQMQAMKLTSDALGETVFRMFDNFYTA